MARKNAVSRTELVEILWQRRYPIIVPAYVRDYVMTFVFVLACTLFGGWLLATGQNIFYGLILGILGGAMTIFCVITLLVPSWRRMVTHEDHARTALGRISFRDVDQFEGGYPLRVRYKSAGPLGWLRNRLRFGPVPDKPVRRRHQRAGPSAQPGAGRLSRPADKLG